MYVSVAILAQVCGRSGSTLCLLWVPPAGSPVPGRARRGAMSDPARAPAHAPRRDPRAPRWSCFHCRGWTWMATSTRTCFQCGKPAPRAVTERNPPGHRDLAVDQGAPPFTPSVYMPPRRVPPPPPPPRRRSASRREGYASSGSGGHAPAGRGRAFSEGWTGAAGRSPAPRSPGEGRRSGPGAWEPHSPRQRSGDRSSSSEVLHATLRPRSPGPPSPAGDVERASWYESRGLPVPPDHRPRTQAGAD